MASNVVLTAEQARMVLGLITPLAIPVPTPETAAQVNDLFARLRGADGS